MAHCSSAINPAVALRHCWIKNMLKSLRLDMEDAKTQMKMQRIYNYISMLQLKYTISWNYNAVQLLILLSVTNLMCIATS